MATDDNILRLAEFDRAKREWLHECLLTDSGKLVANLANALLALRRDPAFAGLFCPMHGGCRSPCACLKLPLSGH